MNRGRIAISGGLCLLLAALAFGMSRKTVPPSPSDPANASSATSSSAAIWIARSDGGKSCAGDSAQSLDDGANQLKAAGVQIISSRKGNDGKAHAQMCGLPSGTENVYQISASDLPKAVVLGYKETTPSP